MSETVIFGDMENNARVDFVIPEGVMERTVSHLDDSPHRTRGTSIVQEQLRRIQDTVGNKYEVVGVPSLPVLAAAAVSAEEMKEIRRKYAPVAEQLRAELRDRIAERALAAIASERG